MGKPLKDEPPNRPRELRKEREKTLEEVAEGAGTSFQQIQRLENRERKMTLQWMHRLAAALDCEPTDLIAAPNPLRWADARKVLTGSEDWAVNLFRRLTKPQQEALVSMMETIGGGAAGGGVVRPTQGRAGRSEK